MVSNAALALGILVHITNDPFRLDIQCGTYTGG